MSKKTLTYNDVLRGKYAEAATRAVYRLMAANREPTQRDTEDMKLVTALSDICAYFEKYGTELVQ